MNDPQEQPTPCLALVPVDPPAKPLNAGRPTVMTPEIIAKLEYVFALGGTDKEACLYADIGLETLYNYQRNHPEFAERKALLKETPVLLVRKTIVEKLGNLDNAQWFLTRKQIEAWMAKMRREGASASTANNVFALLSNMFTKAKDWGYISHDPTKGIEKFKDTVSRDRFLMPDEFQALMKELNSNAKRIIRAKLYTALRIRNLLDLTWIKWTSTER